MPNSTADPLERAFCRGCGETSGERIIIAEMMYRNGESFTYFRCDTCQSISRVGTPQNLSQYYDGDCYYSFDTALTSTAKPSGFRASLMQRRDAGELFGKIPNRLFSWLKPNPALADLRRHIQCILRPNFQSRILDVGCGSGALVHRLRNTGFRNVTGIDPFLPKHQIVAGLLEQSQLSDFGQSDFDLIMMHHVLEHDNEPSKLLEAARDRLAPGGIALVRLPVVAESTWEKYGTHWAELDPPRHSYLPTVAALETLGTSVGLHVQRVDYEAEPFTFAASEIASEGRAFAGETSEDRFPSDTWRQYQNTAMQYAKAGQAPRVAMHFATTASVGSVDRMAIPMSDSIGTTVVAIQETKQ